MSATTFTSDTLAPAGAVAALVGAGYEQGPTQQTQRTLLDTFDGRLRDAALQLELVDCAGLELVLSGRHSAPALVGVPEVPRLAADLPPGPFRSRLAPILEVRALLPVLGVTSRRTRLTRRDRSGKARVSVVLDERLRVEDHDELTTTWVAEVDELAGYDRDAARARDLLQALGLTARAGTVMEVLAEELGVNLAGFRASPTVTLHDGEPALRAFRRVLTNLAGAVAANWPGTVDDIDPEFLHDLRVAVRRTRSVLAQGKRVLPPDVRQTYREGFGWLGTATGRTRDLDVYVIEWDGYVAPLGPDATTALAPVLHHISSQRGVAQALLAEVLRSDRYRRLMQGWTSWLDSPTLSGTDRDAERAIGQVAAERILAAQAQLETRGRSIVADTAAEELHELRKDAKKLRYLLECFGGLYAAGPRKAFVQRLKALQDNLGEHQDTEVHASELRAISAELHRAAGVGPETLIAVGQLTEHLERRRQAAREEFADRFSAYDTKQTRRTLEELLASAGGGA